MTGGARVSTVIAEVAVDVPPFVTDAVQVATVFGQASSAQSVTWWNDAVPLAAVVVRLPPTSHLESVTTLPLQELPTATVTSAWTPVVCGSASVVTGLCGAVMLIVQPAPPPASPVGPPSPPVVGASAPPPSGPGMTALSPQAATSPVTTTNGRTANVERSDLSDLIDLIGLSSPASN